MGSILGAILRLQDDQIVQHAYMYMSSNEKPFLCNHFNISLTIPLLAAMVQILSICWVLYPSNPIHCFKITCYCSPRHNLSMKYSIFQNVSTKPNGTYFLIYYKFLRHYLTHRYHYIDR